MSPEEIKQVLADAARQAAEDATKAVLAQQEQARKEKAAKEAAEAELEAKIKAAVASTVEVGQSGAEKLLAEVEKRFADQAEQSRSAIAGLEAALKEKAVELEVIQRSKMTFADNKVSEGITYADKEKAVLLARMSNKNIDDTTFGRGLVQKYNGSQPGTHLPTATWELEVSMNMEAEVRRRLVAAPLFRQIQMQTNVMKIPVNPEAGSATWIAGTNFGGAPASLGAAGPSAGNTANHALKELTLSAYKVATNEYLAYEEEEDALLAIMPVVRDAMIRRVARAIDRAILRGDAQAADPISGLAKLATGTNVSVTGVGGLVNVASLRTMRKNIGVWGLNPADVVYIVNSSVYYALLEDEKFQTMNQVGPQATLLTGQIGQIGNSPVLVSGELGDPATVAGTTNANCGAICVAPGNFLIGNQRGLRVDTQELVETQRRVMVASMRTGFVQVTDNLGAGVSKLIYV
jgi:hypothetical protein